MDKKFIEQARGLLHDMKACLAEGQPGDSNRLRCLEKLLAEPVVLSDRSLAYVYRSLLTDPISRAEVAPIVHEIIVSIGYLEQVVYEDERGWHPSGSVVSAIITNWIRSWTLDVFPVFSARMKVVDANSRSLDREEMKLLQVASPIFENPVLAFRNITNSARIKAGRALSREEVRALLVAEVATAEKRFVDLCNRRGTLYSTSVELKDLGIESQPEFSLVAGDQKLNRSQLTRDGFLSALREILIQNGRFVFFDYNSSRTRNRTVIIIFGADGKPKRIGYGTFRNRSSFEVFEALLLSAFYSGRNEFLFDGALSPKFEHATRFENLVSEIRGKVGKLLGDVFEIKNRKRIGAAVEGRTPQYEVYLKLPLVFTRSPDHHIFAQILGKNPKPL